MLVHNFFSLWVPPFSILSALGLQVHYHTWISHNLLKDDTSIKIEKTVKNKVFHVFSFADPPFSKLLKTGHTPSWARKEIRSWI